ncbi:MAG: chromosome segregation protein SMC [Candidatus Promineifilaceae bacterium]|nr:chromosome segregation protein SMC [Candidatus Promineifilaceae bacterium]
MMKLKQLDLQGYKTFASKTSFDFSEGITAIVGPNGSGKSNVADAIRWVLGEQSYSTLRGKRTTDMIFAGSQSRARAGMAQVILTLDNSDGWLPIDFTEVEIGRRAYRSGENDYLINGQKVRLRDVQELLATSGLAERTYTIIGQGLIDQALSLRAEERRALFEEAAGISHYQAQRATTLRQLQETERNLERVQDILAEIRPRLGGLKRQANRARDFEQVQSDLRRHLRIWYSYQWTEKKRAVRAGREAAESAETKWKTSRQQLADSREQVEEHRREIGRLQRQIDAKREERERLREQREQLRRQVAVLGERQSFLERQLAETMVELPRLQEQQAAARQELDAALAQLEVAQTALQSQQQALTDFNRGFEARQKEFDRWRTSIARLEREQQQARKGLAQAEGQLSQLRERLQDRQQKPQDATQLLKAEQAIEKLQTAVSAAQGTRDELREKRRELQQVQQQAHRELKQSRQKQGELAQRLNQLNKEVARFEARCDLLDQMRHREVHVREDIRLIGQVASLIRIPAAYQRALEAALGARLKALILPDYGTLRQLLTTNGDKEAILALALDDIRQTRRPSTPKHAEIIGWADKMIERTGEVERAAALLLGRILLVEREEAAYKLGRQLPPGYMAVTPDGFIVHGGGLVEVGKQDPRESVLAREEAWRDAVKALDRQRKSVAEAQAASEKQQQVVAAAQNTYNDIEKEERRLGRLAQEADQRLARVERDLDRARQQRDFILRQRTAAEAEMQQLAQRIERAEQEITSGETETTRIESALAEARKRLAAMPIAEVEQQRRDLKQEVQTARTIVAGREAVVESRRATLHQIEGQLRRQQERRETLAREQKQLELADARTALETTVAEIQRLDGSLTPLHKQREAEQTQVEAAEAEAARAQRQAHDLETHYMEMRVAQSQHENALEGLKERIGADLGLVALDFDEEQGGQTPLPLSEVVEKLPDVEELPPDLEETVRALRAQLNRIGAVNPDAPAEYEATQERYEFLSQQVNDLRQTEARLREVIDELDELTSRAFAATVEEVDDIFSEMFTRLFGGGSARLILTEPDDLTISGVDIIARLPGRRQQRLALLSGGERSLTAAALIFALLTVAPPPFCVLDEVDAMLDEANIARFRELLRELAEGSQFIVITHNRGTVEAAQNVYGISMGSDSASQVLSIRPEEYVNQQEPSLA